MLLRPGDSWFILHLCSHKPGLLIRQILRPGPLQLKALARQDLAEWRDCDTLRSSAMSIDREKSCQWHVSVIIPRISKTVGTGYGDFMRFPFEAMAACPWRFPWTYRQLLTSEKGDFFRSDPCF